MRITDKEREVINVAKNAVLIHGSAYLRIAPWLEANVVTVALASELPDAILIYGDVRNGKIYEAIAKALGVRIEMALMPHIRHAEEFECAVFAPCAEMREPIPGVRCIRIVQGATPLTQPLNFAQRMRVYRTVMQPMIDAGMLSVRWVVPRGKSQSEGKHFYYPRSATE